MLSTPYSWKTTTCLTHFSPAHVNQCPLRMHRLITGLNTVPGYWGTGGPSTAELLDVTGQMPISRHRVRWLGHAARKPETTIVNQLLHADSEGLSSLPQPLTCASSLTKLALPTTLTRWTSSQRRPAGKKPGRAGAIACILDSDVKAASLSAVCQ